MQVVHMSESSPGSTESGQETDKEVEHILLVKMFLSDAEGLTISPINFHSCNLAGYLWVCLCVLH